MNKLLLFAFLLTAAVALLSLRHRRVKFEVEFEIEPQGEQEGD